MPVRRPTGLVGKMILSCALPTAAAWLQAGCPAPRQTTLLHVIRSMPSSSATPLMASPGSESLDQARSTATHTTSVAAAAHRLFHSSTHHHHHHDRPAGAHAAAAKSKDSGRSLLARSCRQPAWLHHQVVRDVLARGSAQAQPHPHQHPLQLRQHQGRPNNSGSHVGGSSNCGSHAPSPCLEGDVRPGCPTLTISSLDAAGQVRVRVLAPACCRPGSWRCLTSTPNAFSAFSHERGVGCVRVR